MYEQLKELEPDSREEEKMRRTDDRHFKQTILEMEEEKGAQERLTKEGLTNQGLASTDTAGSEDESGACVEWRQRKARKELRSGASPLATGATEAEEKRQNSRETRHKHHRSETDGLFRRTFHWLNGNLRENRPLEEEDSEDLVQGADGRR